MTTTPYKGRGALSNPGSRFDRTTTEAVDDGWYADEEPPTSIATTIEPDRAKSVITTNDSPDIPFDYSINPYRGCETGCVYCAYGGTPVLMADGRTRRLADLRVGDEIYGTTRVGAYRRYTKTRVLAHWSSIKPAFRTILEDGTTLITSGDHRFLTERGWKFVTDAEQGRDRRPHLTRANKLMGVGLFATAPDKDDDYRRGYLTGLIRGGATLTRQWLQRLTLETREFVFSTGTATRRPMLAIRTHARSRVERIRTLVAWPRSPTRSWRIGFLAGIFDAEGSYSQGVLRISNTDSEIISQIGQSLDELGFRYVLEHVHRERLKPIDVMRVVGGLQEHLRFFHSTDPAISRKLDIEGQAVKSHARLRVVRIEPLKTMRLYDITTGTGDFIANGVVSHNCYARPSHAYMGLSSGLDFETKLFYKADASRLLRAVLANPRYVCKPVTLGANTDPYQPVEKQLHVTRDILEIFAECRHPVSIVTKHTLILRDLDLLADLARDRLAIVAVSVTSLSAELKRTLEPRAASPQARLKVIEALARAGVPVTALVAPIIPAINDHELEDIVAAVAAAGATSAGYVVLRLPYEVKTLFREWLHEHHPLRAQHVMSVINSLRGGRDNDPRFGTRMKGEGPFAELLRTRFALACKRAGLTTHRRHRELPLATHLFRPPRPDTPQLDLGL